jgi:hypothetical protein
LLATMMEGPECVVRVGHEALVLSEKRSTLVAVAVGLIGCS